MIEIKLMQLRDPKFSEAYQKLMNVVGLAPTSACHVARVGSLLEQELKSANEAHDRLVKQWAEFKNENGETYWKVPDEKIADWTKANMDFHEATATVEKRKITLSELANAKLTPADFLILEPVLSGFDAIEEGSTHGEENNH